jgi:hypothetical protein
MAWRDGASTEVEDWGQMLLIPTSGYLEGPGALCPFRDVEWVELSPVHLKGGIRGIPFQIIDTKDEVVAALQKTHLHWEVCRTTWTIDRFFKNEPVQLLHFVNPFFAPAGPSKKPD